MLRAALNYTYPRNPQVIRTPILITLLKILAVVYQGEADDIVECAGKFKEEGRHLPTEKGHPILVTHHAKAFEPG